jgi:hypothetical protein
MRLQIPLLVVFTTESISFSSAIIAGHLGQTFILTGVPPCIASFPVFREVFPKAGITLEKAVATVVAVTAVIKFLLVKSFNFI